MTGIYSGTVNPWHVPAEIAIDAFIYKNKELVCDSILYLPNCEVGRGVHCIDKVRCMLVVLRVLDINCGRC